MVCGLSDIADRAEESVLAIGRYIIERTQSRQRGLDVTARVEEKCQRYADFPEGGTARPDLGPGIRCFPVDNLLVIYRPVSKSLVPAFIETYQQHPISTEAILDRSDSRVRFTSDFVSQPKLHDTDLYKRVFRELEIEYQARLVLKIGANVMYGMGVNRRHRPFGESDRIALTRLQDCLTYSYRTMRIRMDLQHRSDLLVNSQGKVIAANSQALETLSEFYTDFIRNSRLPAAVVDWLGQLLQFEDEPDSVLPPANPLVKRRGDRTLQIYATASTTPGQFVLAIRVATRLNMDQSITRLIQASAMECRKLSPKEAEVLYWWSQGRSAKEIASVTGLTAARGVLKATKSIEKAVERIYDKLELHDRFEVIRLAQRWLEQRPGEKSP